MNGFPPPVEEWKSVWLIGQVRHLVEGWLNSRGIEHAILQHPVYGIRVLLSAESYETFKKGVLDRTFEVAK